ncbi:MAG: hypothetical protein ACPGH0_05530 [Opitutales bacterium]
MKKEKKPTLQLVDESGNGFFGIAAQRCSNASASFWGNSIISSWERSKNSNADTDLIEGILVLRGVKAWPGNQQDFAKY